MFKRVFTAFAPLVLVLALALAACAGGEKKPVQKTEITFASGGAGGPMHTITSALATVWNEKVPEVNVTNTSTAASVVNCRMTDEGKAQFAFTMSDVAYLAMRGEEMFEEPLKNVMGFASFHSNFVQLITRKDSDIKSVYDLKGKRVGVGAPGSGTEYNARCILEAAGMTYKDLAKADYLSYAETCEQLANGNIDAGFLTGGLPIAAITELSTTKEIKIIPISGDIVNELQEKYPIYFQGQIPAGLYKGVDEAVDTVALKNYIVVNKDVSEDLVYKLAKATYENWSRVQSSHASLKEVSLDTALEGMKLPLHPGAEKFYEEKGLIK